MLAVFTGWNSRSVPDVSTPLYIWTQKVSSGKCGLFLRTPPTFLRGMQTFKVNIRKCAGSLTRWGHIRSCRRRLINFFQSNCIKTAAWCIQLLKPFEIMFWCEIPFVHCDCYKVKHFGICSELESFFFTITVFKIKTEWNEFVLTSSKVYRTLGKNILRKLYFFMDIKVHCFPSKDLLTGSLNSNISKSIPIYIAWNLFNLLTFKFLVQLTNQITLDWSMCKIFQSLHSHFRRYNYVDSASATF